MKKAMWGKLIINLTYVAIAICFVFYGSISEQMYVIPWFDMASGLWQVVTISYSGQAFGATHAYDEDPESPVYVHSI